MKKSSHFAIKHFELIRIAAAVLIGFALALVFLLFVSKDPVNAIRTFILGPFQSTRRFFNIIELAIPLLFTSLGMCFMLRVGEFNLIVEGGFMLSGAVTAWLPPCCLPISRRYCSPRSVSLPARWSAGSAALFPHCSILSGMPMWSWLPSC